MQKCVLCKFETSWKFFPDATYSISVAVTALLRVKGTLDTLVIAGESHQFGLQFTGMGLDATITSSVL